MKKKLTKKDIVNKAIENNSNSYEDKLAILKYVTQNDSKNLSMAISNILKKK